MTNQKKYMSNKISAIWLLAEKGLRIIYGVIITAAVARYLGPEKYGYLAVAMGMIAVVNAASSMGADHFNVSELARRGRKDCGIFLGSALLVRFFWTNFCLALFCCYLLIKIGKIGSVACFLIASVPLSVLALLGNKLQADGNFSNFAIISSINILFSSLIRIIGIYYQYPVEYFAASVLLDSLFYSCIMVCYLIKNIDFQIKSLKPDFETCKYYFKSCFPTAISYSAIVLYSRVELFAINHLMGQVYAGLWAVVVMFITPWGMITSSIVPVVNRELAKLNTNENEYKNGIIKFLRYMLLLSLFGVLFNSVVAKLLVPILMGEEYQKVPEIILVASLSMIPWFSGIVQEVWIAHTKKTVVALKKVVIALPVSGFFLYIFIPKFGMSGAAAAMVVSQITTQIVLNWLFDREYLSLQIKAIKFF